MSRLAIADPSDTAPNTNVSRSISFTILDRDGNEVLVATDPSQPIKIIIPRDENLLVPPMIFQNVTALSSVPHTQTFHLHLVNLSAMTSSFSIHLELRPMDSQLAYLLIYKFDQAPRLNSLISDIDGWSLLCPSTLHTFFLNNQQTSGHRSIIFGIRQLNGTESDQRCNQPSSAHTDPPRSDQPFRFTDDYELRLYTSGCYYLDADHRWRSDGLLVGPLTNLSQTQCLSSHLTTFAGGFLVLPEPINWNYVFANADFAKNKTIYLTVICAAILYAALMIYARFYDKKDIEKVGDTHLECDARTVHTYCSSESQPWWTIGKTTSTTIRFLFSRAIEETPEPHPKCTSLLQVMTMKREFEHSPIRIERSFSAVESMPSSCLFPSKSI